MEQAVQKARILARQLYGDEDLAANPSELRAYFTDLCREFRRDGAIEKAKESVCDFKWPEGALNRDSDDLSHLDSIEELIRLRQADLRPFVLNEDNVRTWFAEDPEFHKLLELAQPGARVEIGPNFVRRSSPPTLLNLHTQLGNIWPAYACDMWEQNLAIILRDDQIRGFKPLQVVERGLQVPSTCREGTPRSLELVRGDSKSPRILERGIQVPSSWREENSSPFELP